MEGPAALADIIGDSAGIRRLREQLEQILTRAATASRLPAILLRGETGTGKGLVARTIHGAGARARASFVDVNCAAIPDVGLLADESVVTAAMLALPRSQPTVADDVPGPDSAPGRSSRDHMRAHLLGVLTETGWNISWPNGSSNISRRSSASSTSRPRISAR